MVRPIGNGGSFAGQASASSNGTGKRILKPTLGDLDAVSKLNDNPRPAAVIRKGPHGKAVWSARPKGMSAPAKLAIEKALQSAKHGAEVAYFPLKTNEGLREAVVTFTGPDAATPITTSQGELLSKGGNYVLMQGDQTGWTPLF